jgi:GNAT superfamily N-acetyltransferase
MRFFVAYLNGVPSAASFLILHGDVATLHRVGTVPEARGRGLGKVVSSYPLQGLKQDGVKLVALLATDEGRAVYEKIGFKSLEQLDLYKKKAA